MPGLDLSQLSSNWKRLQETLQAEKKQEPQSNGLKRKRVDERKAANGFKKTKREQNKPPRLTKSGKMGTTASKPQEPPTTTTTHADLTTTHGIPPSDISAAYGPPPRAHVDDINGGLNPTHRPGKYISLDCEMVGTGPPPYSDNLLARASLVNFHGEQLYDSYVLPPPGVRVEDYRTFVSGVTPLQLVEGYARPFGEVQRDVAELLQGRVLVGHALRNDLNVLMLSHPRRDTRDTSRYPKFRVESKGKPPALRVLAERELGVRIQRGEHSSVEDARAAMGLFRKERVGFEEENRRDFGRRTVFPANGSGKERGLNGEVEGSEGDSGDEVVLDGEEDGDVEDAMEAKASLPKAKKKRKKKKRTKRK